eukprot:1616196-Pleurochrysis_carterae.AAC.1
MAVVACMAKSHAEREIQSQIQLSACLRCSGGQTSRAWLHLAAQAIQRGFVSLLEKLVVSPHEMTARFAAGALTNLNHIEEMQREVREIAHTAPPKPFHVIQWRLLEENIRISDDFRVRVHGAQFGQQL